MTLQRFVEHAKRADAAYQEFIKAKNTVDDYERQVIAHWGDAASAAIALKDSVVYRNLIGTRDGLFQAVTAEVVMAQLHRGVEW
jgi:hypothetical protein